MRKPLWITVLEGDITTSPTFTTVTRVTVVNVGLVVMSPSNTVIHNGLRINVTL